jgi:hypothetical protein
VKLHVDLESFALIEGPGFRNPVTSLRFKRGDAARLEVVFLRNGSTPIAIGDPEALEIRFGIKPRARYDVGYLVFSDAWTLPAPSAESPVYLCSPSFNTTELDSALNVGSSTGSELSEITLMGEITWREGAGEPTSTRTFLVIVENDVNRGTEGVPQSAEPPYPAPGEVATIAALAEAIDAQAEAHTDADDPHPQYVLAANLPAAAPVTVTAPAVNQTTFNPATATVANVADMLAQLMVHLKAKQLF